MPSTGGVWLARLFDCGIDGRSIHSLHRRHEEADADKSSRGHPACWPIFELQTVVAPSLDCGRHALSNHSAGRQESKKTTSPSRSHTNAQAGQNARSNSVLVNEGIVDAIAPQRVVSNADALGDEDGDERSMVLASSTPTPRLPRTATHTTGTHPRQPIRAGKQQAWTTRAAPRPPLPLFPSHHRPPS